MIRWLKLGLIVVFVFLIIALAGCSVNNSSETIGNPGSGEDISSAEEILVASDTTFAPFEFQDQNTGEFVGFDMDILRAIGEVNDWNVQIRSMNFNDIVPALENSSIDLAVSAMSIIERRQEKVDFSYPYYRTDQCVAVQVDNEEIQSFVDLAGKRLGVQASSMGALKAREVTDARLIDYDTIGDAFMALQNGDIDAVINDFPVTAYFIKQGNDDIKIVDTINTNEHYGIAVPKDKPEILEQVNSALKILKENGKYDEIYKEWFNEDPPEYLPGEEPPQQPFSKTPPHGHS